MAATPALANAHPLLDDEQVQGALQLIYELQEYLGAITGLPAVSLQPAAGAHGELTGMLIFSACHQHRQSVRTKIIIPDTAHGTNPASAALCGYKPVPLASGPDGILRVEDVAAVMDDECAGIMITNPNTLGLFESNIREIAEIVHAKGGLVYCDGANMNAVMGIMNAAKCGVDVLHLNLHKTFSTPHGGGGPGAGPVCVTEDLRPFLPVPRVVKRGDRYERDSDQPLTVGRVHGFHGNYAVLIKAYSYIRTMGGPDLKRASQLAVLNANYLKEHLKKSLKLAYDRPCMHECVFSDALQQENKIATIDIAKRLIDYGYHPPTIYFPLVVHGAIMIEPTETETKESLDEFVATIEAIVAECKDNPQVLHDAPTKTKVRRLDETAAARKPFLCG
jgi:glycine dehydrogenase subunit 2